jgi:hypothetical protein
MKDGSIVRYMNKEGKWTKDESVNITGVDVFLEEISGWLKGDFDKSKTFAAKLSPKTITLVPREEYLLQIIDKIELHLSDRPGVMESVEIYENKDSKTTIVFENVRVNVTLKDGMFSDI